MKIHLKFNHNAETVLETIDCPFTSDEVAEQVGNVLTKFMSDDNLDTKGHLAEIMHNELDYTIILFLALQKMTNDLEKKMIKNMLRDMLNNDEDI
jgi:hypothetical protein